MQKIDPYIAIYQGRIYRQENKTMSTIAITANIKTNLWLEVSYGDERVYLAPGETRNIPLYDTLTVREFIMNDDHPAAPRKSDAELAKILSDLKTNMRCYESFHIEKLLATVIKHLNKP